MISQKRHPALIPLSHDHHLGLMAAQRLKRGDAAYRDSPDIPESVLRLWEDELEPHFRQEESVLFVLPEYPDTVRAMIERAIGDHRQMALLIENCAADNAVATGRELGLLLDAHIRFEERELFPAIQECLGEERLREMEGMIETAAKCRLRKQG